MKVSELEGEALDKWVAKAEGAPTDCFLRPYSTEWHVGGPIIEREKIWLSVDEEWFASCGRPLCAENGPTPLIAAMRAYVASKYGEEVPDQESP